MSHQNQSPPRFARALATASVLIMALSAAGTASAASTSYLDQDEASQSSGPSQLDPKPESSGDDAEESLRPVEIPWGALNDPTHSDVVVEEDPTTGLDIVTRSGITHWETGASLARRLMLRADVQDVFTVSITPASGAVSTTTMPRIRINFSVPPGAQAGDTYDVDLNAPWIYAATQTTEIKDANGTVFAVAQPKNFEQKGKMGRWRLAITLTEAVETHSNVQGFVDLQLAYYLNRTAFSGPIVATSDGIQLGKTTGNWSVPASGQQIETAGINGGAFTNGKPAIVPVIRINYDRIPASGWKVTISNLSPGLTPSCEGRTQVQTSDTNGWLIDTAGWAEPDPCTASTQVFTITRAMAQKIGASGSIPVNLRTTIYGDKANTAYSLRMTSNVAVHGVSTWNLSATTGEGSEIGADYLSLNTSKTAELGSSRKDGGAAFGDIITYTITTTPGKHNDRAISNVITTDHLPEGLKFIAATNNGTYDSEKRTVTWGPRFLSSTGRFVDEVRAEVVSTTGSTSLTNRVVNKGDGVCGGSDAQSTCEAEVTTPLALPSYAFAKTSELIDANKNGWKGDEGDGVKYIFTVKNTGNIVISTAKLSDKMLGISDHECLKAPLAAGASAECSGEFLYTITKEDVERGTVGNQATLCVDPELGLSCQDGSTTTPTIKPSFSFEKTVVEITDVNGKKVETGKASLGDHIHFGFEVTNTGNVDLTSVFVSDPLLGASQVPCLAPGTRLEPAQKVKCAGDPEYTYVVTASDVNAGQVHNVAVGSVPGLPDDEGETTTPTQPDPLDPALPSTGSIGTLALLSLGGVLVAAGAGGVALQYRYSSRRPLHNKR